MAEAALIDATAKTQQLAQAGSASRIATFFGVPISIKDLNPRPVSLHLWNPVLKNELATYDDR